ncbi:MAG: NADAR family protein [Chloroflexi bacterium]|nr:NADAR family protein [Chloroflexota bacterium]
MLELLRDKFRDPVLRQMLLDTGDLELVEGNNWGDRFWGRVSGVGDNHLGRLLMQVRGECRRPVR